MRLMLLRSMRLRTLDNNHRSNIGSVFPVFFPTEPVLPLVPSFPSRVGEFSHRGHVGVVWRWRRLFPSSLLGARRGFDPGVGFIGPDLGPVVLVPCFPGLVVELLPLMTRVPLAGIQVSKANESEQQDKRESGTDPHDELDNVEAVVVLILHPVSSTG